MDFHSKNERKNKQSRHFNMIFLGIFLIEIIVSIAGLNIFLPMKKYSSISLTFTIFISGIYTVSYKIFFFHYLLLI